MANHFSIVIKGKIVDEHTRCVHYHSALDIIAIKFKCCGEYYPCYQCHEKEANHVAQVWMENEFATKAVLCGMCYNEMTIQQYLDSNYQCPFCGAAFNPKCERHYHFYFEV